MAEYTQNPIIYYATIDITHKEKLGYFRLWTNLKLAYDDKLIWLKDLTEDQIVEYKLRSIPGCCIYIEKAGKLYPKDSLLPCGKTPSLLWTPIARAIPVTLPRFNDNFMGLGDNKIDIDLEPSANEQDVFAMMVNRRELEQYILTAPASRLRNLKWTVLSDEKMFIVGTPLLPIKGEVFWRYKHLLLPAGFNFNYPILSDYINRVCTSEGIYICWLNASDYIKIEIDKMEDLSIASFKITNRSLESV